MVRVVRWCISPQVYPLADFPLREISLASQRGIAQHSAATLASRARVLQQVSRRGRGCFWARRGFPGPIREERDVPSAGGSFLRRQGGRVAGESLSEEHEVDWGLSWGQCGLGQRAGQDAQSMVTGLDCYPDRKLLQGFKQESGSVLF